jgi:hypothetical protein
MYLTVRQLRPRSESFAFALPILSTVRRIFFDGFLLYHGGSKTNSDDKSQDLRVAQSEYPHKRRGCNFNYRAPMTTTKIRKCLVRRTYSKRLKQRHEREKGETK